jgi:hypothetical protein
VNFEEFKNKHAGESILVCGLGESLSAFLALIEKRSAYTSTSIGVNDIGRAFTPTYLLNVNNRHQYRNDRFSYIENTRAKALFTHNPKEQGKAKVPIVTFELTREVGSVKIEGRQLPHFRNSPYMALALAGYMGAKRIGLIGVDFTDNHFWIKDGPHRLQREFDRINAQYGKLAEHLGDQGIEVFNLSPISRLTSIAKLSLSRWE